MMENNDMREQLQKEKEVEEFIRRCNISPYTYKTGWNRVILKFPSLSKQKLEEVKRKWEKFIRSSKPITTIDPEATIEFIPSKRPHRLHNHPIMEMKYCKEDEVIIDVEFFKSVFFCLVNI